MMSRWQDAYDAAGEGPLPDGIANTWQSMMKEKHHYDGGMVQAQLDEEGAMELDTYVLDTSALREEFGLTADLGAIVRDGRDIINNTTRKVYGGSGKPNVRTTFL